MIKKLVVRNFKGFEKYTVDFGQINLLVGANNAGKTTIFYALKLLFWCMEATAKESGSHVTFEKTQRAEVKNVPYFQMKDLFFKQKMRRAHTPIRITLELETDQVKLKYDIYQAFSTNIMIDGGKIKITKAEYEKIRALRPIFIPSLFNVTVQEELYREIAQERLILDGKHNQVLRNLIFRLKQNSGEWESFTKEVNNLFQNSNITVPFNEKTDEWLTAQYKENDCRFDLISAGSGFLQVLNLLALLFLSKAKVVLLDEPDAHLHEDLQRTIFKILSEIAIKRDLQLVISTHSPTLIDSIDLENVLVIDKNKQSPVKPESVKSLVPILADSGLGLPQNKILEILRTSRVLFVENEVNDFNYFWSRLIEKYTEKVLFKPPFTVISTGGVSVAWPEEAIKAFEKLLGQDLRYVYIADRDFSMDGQLAAIKTKRSTKKHVIEFLPWRNRECFLLNTKVLNQILSDKWSKKNVGKSIPSEFSEVELKKFILAKAKALETETHTKLLLQQESYIKSDRPARTQEVNECFKREYTDMLSRSEIPNKLLEGKQILKDLRSEIQTKHGIVVSDSDILNGFSKTDIPSELGAILKGIKETLLD